jgi:hypothetical protein
MGKAVLSAYRGFTAAAIKSRASVPNQADMTVVGTTVECANIDIVKIRNALGISALDFVSQHQSADVNQWSGFGPTKRTISSQALVNSEEAPRGLYEFAGYNHNAVTPGWIGSAPSGNIWVTPGGTAYITVDVNVGEVRYQEIAGGIVGITLAIYYGGSLMGWASRNFESSSVQNDVTGLSVALSTWVDGRTYTGKVWLVSDTTEFDDTQIVCRLPNTSDFTVTVNQMAATTVMVNDSGFTVVGAGCVPSEGRAGFTSFSHPSYQGNVLITCRLLRNSDSAQIGSTITMYDQYYGGADDYPSTNPAYPNGYNAVDNYGYTFVIDVSPY